MHFQPAFNMLNFTSPIGDYIMFQDIFKEALHYLRAWVAEKKLY